MALDKNYYSQVTPEQVIKVYADHGQTITINQSNQIIELLYMIAEIALDIAEEELKKEQQSGSNPNGFKTGSE